MILASPDILLCAFELPPLIIKSHQVIEGQLNSTTGLFLFCAHSVILRIVLEFAQVESFHQRRDVYSKTAAKSLF